jgi:hypothetical protein
VCFGPAVQVLDLPDIAFGAQTTLAYDAENSADTGGTLSVTDGRHAAATRGKSTVKTALAGLGWRIRTLGSREAASRAWLDRNGGAIGAPYSLQNGLDWGASTLWQLSRE